jgi:hypothetical protein
MIRALKKSLLNAKQDPMMSRRFKTVTINQPIFSLPADAINGQLSVSLKGNSIFNYANNGVDYANWSILGTAGGASKGSNGIHLVQYGSSELATLPTNLKPNTEYTLIYNVKAVTLSQTIILSSTETVISTNLTIPKTLGLNKYKFTTQAAITTNCLKFACLNTNIDGEYIDFEVYSILEGDQTANAGVNKPLGYGVKSTLSTRLQTKDSLGNVISEAYLPEVGRSVNTVKDEVNVTTGQKVQRVQSKVLQASDVPVISTSLTNVDIALIPKPLDSKGKGLTTTALGMYTIEGYTEIYPYQDDVSSIGKFWVTTTADNIVVVFAKGTTLAQAQAALAGKMLNYQLKDAQYEYYIPEVQLGCPDGLKSIKGGTFVTEPIGDPAESTQPEIVLTYEVAA